MALELKDLKLLVSLRKKYPQGKSLCILGDCHFYFDNRTLFNISHPGGKKYYNDFSSVTLKTLGEALNFDIVETIDISENPTHKLDLQKPIPKNLLGKFDWIIDSGTLYWCFDIAAVWKNLLLLLKEKGFIFHTSSLTGYFGRGYYSFQPRLFTDFYKQNGFRVLTLGYRVRPSHILHNKYSLISLFYLLFRKIRGMEEKLEWQLLTPNNIYLAEADRLSMKFKNIMSIPEPDMIPNSTMCMCFSQRTKKVPFKMPILSPW